MKSDVRGCDMKLAGWCPETFSEFEQWLFLRERPRGATVHWYARLVMDGIGYGHELVESTTMADNVTTINDALVMLRELNAIRPVALRPSTSQSVFGWGEMTLKPLKKPPQDGPPSWWSWTRGENLWLPGGPAKCGTTQSG